MTYADIAGWFDFHGLYADIVAKAPTDRKSVFVEVGAFLGRSAAFLGEQIQGSGKPIVLFCVDSWCGSVCKELEDMFERMEREAGKTTYDMFLENIRNCGLSHIITPIKALSVEGPEWFEDKSCDFVFIDADHSKDAVTADIKAWLPKVRPGGTLAGHDYNRESVYGPVHELLGKDNIEVHHINGVNIPSWIYKVPGGGP